MSYRFRQILPDAPLDIIGDVHGEFAAFRNLLRHLGYDAEGLHPEARKIVFVGDLCDRGPDSPRMLEWFKKAHEAGRAWMVLGNHELNLLADDPKDGSGWFFDSRAEKDAANYAPWQRLPASGRAAVKAWLAEQPLVLERADIRIVHAAWLPETFACLEEAAGESLPEQYRRFDRELIQTLQTASWYTDYQAEQAQYGAVAEYPHTPPPPMPATAQYDLARSRAHPIRALSSGVECLAEQMFYAGGRWRGTCRMPWWNEYAEDTPVVIGHYWRMWHTTANPVAAERSLLPTQGNAWHGLKRNVFCVDFSIGASWRARKQPEQYAAESFRLAALRWPERVLVFDNGESVDTE